MAEMIRELMSWNLVDAVIIFGGVAMGAFIAHAIAGLAGQR